MLIPYIIVWILIILLLVFLSMAIVYQEQFNACKKYPSPWCFTDWKCYGPNGKEVEMSKQTLTGPSGVINRCSPLTVDTLKEFKYSTKDDPDTIITKHPSTEVNPSAPVTGTHYAVGDIYWTACSGGPASNLRKNEISTHAAA